MHRREDAGFTLIELMVVIAIILILIIMLFPALRGARQRANDAAAASYLREAANYMEQYNIENNTYAGVDSAALLAAGLKPVPANVTFAVLDTSPVGYCMTAIHAGGTGITFGATSQGITRTPCVAAQ